MHQRSYIDHCLKSNDMEKLKGLTTLPALDERSPPEEEVDEDGQTTDYEMHTSGARSTLVSLCGWPHVLDQTSVLHWAFWLLRWSSDQNMCMDV